LRAMWAAQANMPPAGGYAVVACAPQDELSRLRESNAHLLRVGAMREDQLKKYESFEATNVVVRNKLSETVLEKTRSLEEAARIMGGMRDELRTQQRTAKADMETAKKAQAETTRMLEESLEDAKQQGAARAAAVARVVELQRSVAALATDATTLRKEAAQLAADRSKALLLVEATANDVIQLKRELAKERGALADLRTQSGEAAAALEQLAADRAALDEAAAALKAGVAADRAELKAGGEQLAAERAVLDEAAAALQAGNEKLAADRAALDERLEKLVADHAVLEDQLARDRAMLALERGALCEQLTVERATLRADSEKLVAPPRRKAAATQPPASERPQRRAKTEAMLKMLK